MDNLAGSMLGRGYLYKHFAVYQRTSREALNENKIKMSSENEEKN